ncbi:hypothetical protein ASF61_16785 [Duganella sp. Leaf126]|uniref:phage tail tube protein n=1 Tax=Duganella sp. Leaf126 TaxID=1736266 RepID=UPI0006FA60D0|nr:phage tail tube protein [Duganella sp. Leaf126]KQQ31990.1 hypothetical protein ASF61_16785 [Duganella sp. Leaf126]
MGYSLPEGSSQQYSSTFAAAKVITAISNADGAVATCAAHGYSTGDEVLIVIGWEDATEAIYRVTSVTADTFRIEGLDSTDTDLYPVVGGKGTAQKVSGWQAIPKIENIDTSGGDPKYTEANPLARKRGIKIPAGFNPISLTVTMGYDPSDAVYQDMLKISRASKKVAFKQVIKGAGTTFGYSYLSVSDFPKLSKGNVNTVDASVSLIGGATTYPT